MEVGVAWFAPGAWGCACKSKQACRAGLHRAVSVEPNSLRERHAWDFDVACLRCAVVVSRIMALSVLSISLSSKSMHVSVCAPDPSIYIKVQVPVPLIRLSACTYMQTRSQASQWRWGVESHLGLQEAAADAVDDDTPPERGGRGCEDVHSYYLTILAI